MNNTTSLKWTVEGPTTTLNFMDLTITIKNNKLHFKTFQKPTSLYQYIPANSAHPPGMLKSIIFGRTQKYWVDNTEEASFLHFMNILSNRLLKQGYKKPTLNEITSQSLEKYCLAKTFNNIQKSTKTKDTSEEEPDPNNTFYYILPYHRRGVQRKQIQSNYKKYISPHLPHKLTVAFKRPTNLKDQLCKTTLPDIPGDNPSDFLNEILNNKKKTKN